MLTNRFIPHILFEEAGDQGGGSAGDEGNGESSGNEPESKTGQNIGSLDEALDELKNVRKEAAKYRRRSKDYDKVKEQLKDLKGFKSKVESFLGEDEDPEEKVKSLEQENRQLKLERDISKAAKKHNADEELVTAVLMRNGDLDGDIDEAVKKAVENNPKLKAEQPKTTGDAESEDTDEESLSMNDLIRKAAGR